MVAEGRELIAAVVDLDLPGSGHPHGGLACNFIGDGLRDAIDPKLRLR